MFWRQGVPLRRKTPLAGALNPPARACRLTPAWTARPGCEQEAPGEWAAKRPRTLGQQPVDFRDPDAARQRMTPQHERYDYCRGPPALACHTAQGSIQLETRSACPCHAALFRPTIPSASCSASIGQPPGAPSTAGIGRSTNDSDHSLDPQTSPPGPSQPSPQPPTPRQHGPDWSHLPGPSPR